MNLNIEIWKDIEGYEGLYQISTLGRVKSLERLILRNNGRFQKIKERILKPSLDRKGYYFVVLKKDCKSLNHRIHRLIAQAFIPNPENKPCVDHIDTNTKNNNINNLRWCTHKENMNNTITKEKQIKIMTGKCGEKHPRARKINQYTKNGILLKEWGSIADITRDLNLHQSSISNCCGGKYKSVGGYIWKYVA